MDPAAKMRSGRQDHGLRQDLPHVSDYSGHLPVAHDKIADLGLFHDQPGLALECPFHSCLVRGFVDLRPDGANGGAF